MEKRGNVLAIISSASHYYFLLEYLFQTKIDITKCHLINFVLKKGSTDYDFFINHISTQNFYKIDSIFLWDSKVFSFSNIRKLLNYHKLVRRLKREFFEEIICSQIEVVYMTHICHAIKNFKLVSLDEGNAVLRVVEERKTKFGVKTPIIWKYKLMNLKYEQLNNITFFTSYNFETLIQDDVIKCKYEFSKLMNVKKKVDENVVLFIGSSFVEDKMLSKEYDFYLLCQIAKLFKGKRIVYYPHRRESNLRLEKIKNSLNMDILEIRKPIELELLDWKELCGTVISFYSAALLNLKMSLSNLNYIAFRFDINKIITLEHHDVIRKVYNEFENNGIKVIDID